MTTPHDQQTVPPEELNKRRRMLQLADELEQHFGKCAAAMNEMQELGGSPDNIRDEMIARLERLTFDTDNGFVLRPEQLGGGHSRLSPMWHVISRLFAEAPKLTNPDGSVDRAQKPAVECHVLLRGVHDPIYGSLSLSDEGALKMLAPANLVTNGQQVPKLMEHFFEVDDVVSIILVRDMAAEKSRIVTA